MVGKNVYTEQCTVIKTHLNFISSEQSIDNKNKNDIDSTVTRVFGGHQKKRH